MMALSFDLISDLHVETWSEKFDWRRMPTSPVCVIAGDIAKNRDVVASTLENLSKSYQNILYIDGNEEHKFFYDDISNSHLHLSSLLEKYNIINLKDRVVVIDGVAFIGCNGWWTYDLDEPESYDDTKRWYVNKANITMNTANTIEELAMHDASYLSTSVAKLQTHQDVKEIVIVTHTVPFPELIEHDIELSGSHLLNTAGNSHIGRALSHDTEAKISTWCFGHYHGGDIDTFFKGVRFVNNPRGRGDTRWCKQVYNPKKIVL